MKDDAAIFSGNYFPVQPDLIRVVPAVGDQFSEERRAGAQNRLVAKEIAIVENQPTIGERFRLEKKRNVRFERIRYAQKLVL